MKVRKISIAAFAILYSYCFLLFAQTQQLNLVGEYIPDATNNDGTGFQFEMVKAIFEPLGYQVNINIYPYRRAIKKVESGQADMMIGMIKHSDMPLAFSHSPHEVDKIFAIFLKGNRTNWQGISTLKKKKFVMLTGMEEDAIKRLPILSNQISVVSTPAQALKMLIYSRADILIMTESEYITNYINIDNPQTNLLTKSIGFIEIHAAFTDSTSGNKLKRTWDKHFHSYLMSEQAKQMFDRWGVSRNYNTTLNYLAEMIN